MDEEGLDRRLHWGQWAITGIVIATAWCVRLEFTVASLKAEMENQKANRDKSIALIWERFGSDHDLLIRHDEDLKRNEHHQ